MIELEMFLVFYTALFFSAIYVLTSLFDNPGLLWGVLSWAAWFALGLMWLFISPMSTAYTIGLLFQAIGFMFLLSVVVGYYKQLQVEKWGESELD